MNSYFDYAYKKSSSRLRLLHKIRPFVNVKSCEKVLSSNDYTLAYLVWNIATEL